MARTDDLFYYDSQTAYGRRRPAAASRSSSARPEVLKRPAACCRRPPSQGPHAARQRCISSLLVAQVPRARTSAWQPRRRGVVCGTRRRTSGRSSRTRRTLSQSAYNVLTMLWYKPEGRRRRRPSRWWPVVDFADSGDAGAEAGQSTSTSSTRRCGVQSRNGAPRTPAAGGEGSCRKPSFVRLGGEPVGLDSMYESVLQLWAYAAMAERFGIKLNAPTVTSIHTSRRRAEGRPRIRQARRSRRCCGVPTATLRLHRGKTWRGGCTSRRRATQAVKTFCACSSCSTCGRRPRRTSPCRGAHRVLPSRQSDVDRAIFADSASGGHWTLLRLVGKTAANTWTQTTRLSVGTMLAAAGSSSVGRPGGADGLTSASSATSRTFATLEDDGGHRRTRHGVP